MQDSNKLIRIVTAALMAALTCIVTMILPIKIPYGNGGYIHPGDGFVLLSGIILGPIFGGLAAGIGSLIADILSGYPQYAAATLIIKFLAAMLGGYSYRRFRQRSVILAGILGGIVVTSGYYIYDCILSGSFMTGLATAPFNLLQNVVGIILACILLPLLTRVPQVKAMISSTK